MTRWMFTNNTGNLVHGHHSVTYIVNFVNIQMTDIVIGQRHNLSVYIKITINVFVERKSLLACHMETLYINHKLPSEVIQFLRLAVEGVFRCLFGNIQDRLHLCQEGFLVNLVGMEFQTEWHKSDILQSFLHHFKGCFLFGDKQHTLVLIESIGNHVCDGL